MSGTDSPAVRQETEHARGDKCVCLVEATLPAGARRTSLHELGGTRDSSTELPRASLLHSTCGTCFILLVLTFRTHWPGTPPVLRKMSLLGRPARLRPGLTERTLPGGHRWQSTAVPRLAETSLSRTQAPRALLLKSAPFSASTLQVHVPAALTLKTGPGGGGATRASLCPRALMRPAAQCLESSPKRNAARCLGACRQGHTGSSPDRPGPEEEGVGCHVHIGSCGSPGTSGRMSRKRPAPSPAAVMPPSPDTWPRALLPCWGTGSHPAGAPSGPECAVCAVCTWERTSVCVHTGTLRS